MSGSKGRKILVVDDDVENAWLMREILQDRAYEVRLAHNGLTAVEETAKSLFDLILLDLRIPFFSGFEFCELFKRKSAGKETPVVVVSALPPQENMERAYQVGAAAYLMKPFRAEQLLGTVERILRPLFSI